MGFFHQHMAAAFERQGGNVVMGFGGGGDDHRVGDIEQIGQAHGGARHLAHGPTSAARSAFRSVSPTSAARWLAAILSA